MLRSALVISICLLGACVAAAQTPTPEELAWIRDHAIPLRTVTAGHGFDDLAPLKAVIGNARVVALGEGTHGTREFFQAKHRLIEYLASELGFTIFSIEASMPEAYRVDDFVRRGEGDPARLLGGMYFWTWNTQEVLDMLHWMRAHNQAGRALSFTGFDMQTPDVAMQTVRDFVGRVEPDYAQTVTDIYAAALTVFNSAGGGGGSFGVATGTFPLQAAAGKKVRFSGYIRTEGVTRAWAGLWWRVDGEGSTLAFDNMRDRGAKGDTPWTAYAIELDVPAKATNINFGVLHCGDGSAWFDDLKVEIDGQPFDSAGQFDFDFESGQPQGFATRGAGYEIDVDDARAQRGQHSLRMRYRGDNTPTSGPGAPLSAEHATESCRKIWDHLRQGRADYAARASAEQADWAIQNARLVVQCGQARSNPATRDESMAENVGWILNHAPPATRIVLWAHNGHVRRDGGFFTGRAMGGYLSKKLGKDFVVVGFACNSGQYTAIASGKGLQPNDLQPAAPGSVEYYLHSSGLPAFIIDLRAAEAGSAASGWLHKSLNFRAIGALAMDQQFQPTTVADAFDVLVYIDETTPTKLLGR